MEVPRQKDTAHSNASSSRKKETAMDTYLRSNGLYRKKVTKDGSCLFRAVAEQVLHSQAQHLEIRKSCIDYLRENRAHFEAFIEGSFEEYLKRLENPQEWVGQVEISALSLMFKKDFIIYQEPSVSPAHVTDNGFADKIMLCFSNGNHYDIIYSADFVENAAVCQSIIYELLYEKVFKVDVEKYVSKAGNFDTQAEEEVFESGASGSDGESEDAGNNELNFADMNGFKTHKDGKLAQRKDVLPSVPSSVIRSLHSGVYRNVEYEIWMKLQRDQEKLDFSIASGMQYSVGDKCQVCLEPGGVFYDAHIQEVGVENGPAVVFVEELGQKYDVQLKNLKPAPLAMSRVDGWNTVAGKKIKKSSASGPAVQFEKDYRGQKSYGKPVKSQPASSPRLQQVSVAKQHGLSSDQATLSENKGRSRTPPKVPGKKLERERSEESNYFKRETLHFGLTPEERREKQVIEESKSLYEMQHRDTDAFPALSATVVDASVQSSDGLPVKKCPTINSEKSTRRKSEVEDLKSSQLTQPASVSDQKLSEEITKPHATSEAVLLHDVTVLPSPAELQTPTTVPSVPPMVTPWSGIPDEMPVTPGTGSDSAMLQPQVTSSPYSPLTVSMPAVNQPLLPLPQTLSAYQDPLYPGFPVNEKGERATAPPPYSLYKNGDDLPSDKSILHFFYNLGIKAFTCPMWPPHFYLHPLHQAYLNMCRMYPNVHVYPQNHWVQETTVDQSDVDPSVFAHQSDVRNENHSATLCPPGVLTSSVQMPAFAGSIPPQPNQSEEKHPFQTQGSDFEDSITSKTMYSHPPFGQGSYMGPVPIASPFFPPVWYGYPYQGYIENAVVRQNVFVTPMDRDLPGTLTPGDVMENISVQEAIKQPQELMNECKPDLPVFSASATASEPGSQTALVKAEQVITPDTTQILEQQSLPTKLTDIQFAPPVLPETPEDRESAEKEMDPVAIASAQINPPDERPPRAREESSEDEREVSNLLSRGRSKNFYNQSYGTRRPRNERLYQPNRGGYQYFRNDEGWKVQRNREDGYQHHRYVRGRPSRRRPMGDRPQHE
ncbi:OTU domain-containing protein 4 [Pseudophryne corroboree]|uniref:OTU domain-containing protein 4 n=1 Tax=Pseudophryne corroboree TaxID=495146 RepID=UPI003081DC27